MPPAAFASKYRSWILLFFSFLCTSFAAGLVYGWPALRRQLQEDGSELSEKTLGAIFTVGAWSTQGSRFFTGLSRDRFGTRIVVCICLLIVAFGCLGVALSDPNKAGWLGTSLFLIGLGSGVQLCILPVASLFPAHTGVITSSLAGAFQISGLMFLALTNGTSRRAVAFVGYAAGLLLLAGLAAFLLPKGQSFLLTDDPPSSKESTLDEEGIVEPADLSAEAPLPSQSHYCDQAHSRHSRTSTTRIEKEEEDVNLHLEENSDTQPRDDEEDEESLKSSHEDNESGGRSLESASDRSPTAIEQLKTLEYILLIIWFSVCLVPLQYYIGSLGFQLESKGDDGFYTDLFSIIYASSSIVAPAGGYLADRLGHGVAQGFATLLIAASLFILGSNQVGLDGQVFSLLAYGMGRMFIFGSYFSNNGKRFGYVNYGTLVGFGLLASAIVSLLQFPLIALAADGEAAAVNFGCGVALLCLSPYFFWLRRKEQVTSVAGNS